MRIASVFLGGGLGATGRALVLQWLAPLNATIPLGVLAINAAGSLILGAVYALADEYGLLRPAMRLFLAVGVLGGFTTFSTFVWGVELLVGQESHGSIAAAVYVAGSIAGGLLGVIAGLALGRLIGRGPSRGEMIAVETEMQTDDASA